MSLLKWNVSSLSMPQNTYGGSFTVDKYNSIVYVSCVSNGVRAKFKEGIYVKPVDKPWEYVSTFPETHPTNIINPCIFYDCNQNKLYIYHGCYGIDGIILFDMKNKTYDELSNFKSKLLYPCPISFNDLFTIKNSDIHVITPQHNIISSTNPLTHMMINTNNNNIRIPSIITQTVNFDAYKFLLSVKQDLIIAIGLKVMKFNITNNQWSIIENIEFDDMPVDVAMSTFGDVVILLFRNNNYKISKHILKHIIIDRDNQFKLL